MSARTISSLTKPVDLNITKVIAALGVVNRS
jgi:hypothetical protein